jgi:hypothetical protein
MPRRLSGALVAASLLLAAFTAHVTRGNGQGHFLATQRYEDVYYLPPPDWLQVFSLGHREALADLIWLRALIYFGDELRHRGEVHNLYNYTDAMLALDPYFKRVYQWVATNALYRTGTISERDARRAIAYLQRGVRLFPDDGDLAWTLGATYLYELPTLLPMDQRDEARRKGLEHLQVAARLGAGPPWLALSTATVLGKLGKREQQIAHLEEVYDQVSDPKVKEQIELRLAQLRSAAFAEALKRTNEELEQARQRDFPYVDRDLYLLLAPKPAFDGTALLLRNFDPVPDLWNEGELSASSESPPP